MIAQKKVQDMAIISLTVGFCGQLLCCVASHNFHSYIDDDNDDKEGEAAIGCLKETTLDIVLFADCLRLTL